MFVEKYFFTYLVLVFPTQEGWQSSISWCIDAQVSDADKYIYTILYMNIQYITYIIHILPIHYDNFGVYCKKIDVNKDYNWDCCDHFLYYNLPKILLPKGVISYFHVDIIFVTFVVTSFSSERRRPTNQNKQILVNFLFWNFKSKNFFRQLLSEKW